MIDRVHKELTEEDFHKIAQTYHDWRSLPDANQDRHSGLDPESLVYEDIPGFCKAAHLEEIKKNDYVLTPGRYVGMAEVEDDGIPFEEKMEGLSQQLFEQMKEGEELDNTIRENLKILGYGE